MSHWRLNNPRSTRAKSALARRVKHKPRHAFCAERAITALLSELASVASRPLYWSGTSDLAVVSIQCDINVWCRNGRFFWNDLFHGGPISHPANDPVGAAELLNPFAREPEHAYGQLVPHTIAA